MGRAPARQSSDRADPASKTPVSGAYERGAVPRPTPSPTPADVLPTVRNFVPWREMERKLAERFAARAAAGELEASDVHPEVTGQRVASASEPPPSSKIRPTFDQGEFDDLSFTAYTLADLDARRAARPESAPVPEAIVAHASPWEELADGRWPAEWDPKKIAVTGSMALGALWALTLLVVVLADFADPMRPVKKGIGSPTTTLVAPTAMPVAAPIAMADAPPAVTPEPALAFELDDEAPVAAPARVASPKRLPARKKGR